MNSRKNVKIAPSVLSADFSKMGEEIESVNTSDLIHLDVMDGVFVPNISFGMKMVKDVRKITSLPLDCHLMIVNPEKYIKSFAEAGADYITVHYEAVGEKAEEILNAIKALGVKAGLAINPDTPIERAERLLPLCDLFLVMSVFPGFGGQKFIAEVLVKCKRARELAAENGYKYEIEIDGGINEETAKFAAESGCDILVAGSAVFSAKDRKKAIEILR